MYSDDMIQQRSRDGADAIIWIGTALLAFVLGAGSAAYLWFETHLVADAYLLGLAVAGLTVGLACVAASLDKRVSQAMVVLFALSLALGYFVLAPNLIHSA